MAQRYFEAYTKLLEKELIPALGCTEPIALAYAAAKARKLLGSVPEHILVRCSGNVIKNVKSVKVPFAEDMYGIEASVLLGALGGNADQGLEVLTDISKDVVEQSRALLGTGFCQVEYLSSKAPLHIIVQLTGGGKTVSIELRDGHTNIVRIVENGIETFRADSHAADEEGNDSYYPQFSLEKILKYADEVEMDKVYPIIRPQIRYNMQIAEEGLRHFYGANVGKTILNVTGDSVEGRAQAYAAAGSDARMGGCTMPVVINSGSGNQGMAVSLPVIQYAGYYHKSEERTVRALLVSNLVAIYQKSQLGTLSAFCGAVCAATGSGAGIAYLMGENQKTIATTIVNTLANVGGILCDGAKASCAAKIAAGVNAAILGYHMAINNNSFHSGDGLVKETTDNTFRAMMTVGREGMRRTDEVILEVMMQA